MEPRSLDNLSVPREFSHTCMATQKRARNHGNTGKKIGRPGRDTVDKKTYDVILSANFLKSLTLVSFDIIFPRKPFFPNFFKRVLEAEAAASGCRRRERTLRPFPQQNRLRYPQHPWGVSITPSQGDLLTTRLASAESIASTSFKIYSNMILISFWRFSLGLEFGSDFEDSCLAPQGGILLRTDMFELRT